jgi:DNA (cytosine-5)-methyltransferase 1
MLRLDGGNAMAYLTRRLEELGFMWAYRVVDTRAFGLPQRRRRVFILSSRTEDPRAVLFSDDVGEPPEDNRFQPGSFGFYWTEGIRGLGLATDAVPALKPGSRISIPSPPAIWLPRVRKIVVPDVRDAERLQGFPANWTKSIADCVPQRRRWGLIGNAVSVPVALWLAKRLLYPGSHDLNTDQRLSDADPWGGAGWGWKGIRYRTEVSEWPVQSNFRPLHEFLNYPPRSLSTRATAGFLQRALASKLRFPAGFLDDIAYHLKCVRAVEATTA